MPVRDSVVLVTGATGFLGRHVLATITGVTVVPWRRSSFGDLRVARLRASAMRVVQPDAVIHLAWEHTDQPGYEYSAANDEWADASLALAQLCGERDVWFIGAGSAADGPFDERFDSPYASAKRWLREQVLALGGTTTWFSPQFVFSMQDARPRLLREFIDTGSRADFRVANPDAYCDFVHVDDVASGIASIVSHRLLGRVYLGSGIERSPQDLVSAAALQAHQAGVLSSASVWKVAGETPEALKAVGWRPAATEAYFEPLKTYTSRP